MDIKNKINSYEDACKLLNIQPLTLEHFSFLPENQRQYQFSMHRITTAIEAINEGHKFDWNNWSEYKYLPWWDMETYGDAPAGSGFAFHDYGCDYTITGVGARLCTRSASHTKHIAQVFLEDYRIIIKG